MSENKETPCIDLSMEILDKLYLLKYDINYVQKK